MTSAAGQVRQIHRVGAIGQVGALVRIRAGALRGRARYRALAGLSLLPLLAVAAVITGTALPAGGVLDARLLMPTAWLGFVVTAVVTAGTGGARTLLPRAQTVTFPLTAGAEQLGALLLAPLNVAWVTQTLGLLTLAGWAFGAPRALLPALVLTVAWIWLGTVLGQAVNWLTELARSTRAGPWLLRGTVLAALTCALGLTLTGQATRALDRDPIVHLVASLATAETGDLGPWLAGLAVLLAGSVLGYLAGLRLAGRLQRRASTERTRREARNYPGRADPHSDQAAALRLDRAGVWRSAPLRRGLGTLIVVPGLAAAAAGLNWSLAPLLPGLVASGAGLLFGVNALSLDGSGGIWRESLPGTPRTIFLARLIVLTEVCLTAAVVAAVIGALRAPDRPSPADLVAVAGALVATTAQVVGRCATWSVDRPYPATLTDVRDQPAPPAAMAGYSARLAVTTTVTGLVFSLCARYGLVLIAVTATVAITAVSLRRIVAALRSWDDAAIRSRVIAVVAG